MGSWNAVDFVSGLPIRDGEKVACFLLDYRTDYDGALISRTQFLPLFGEYDDYGRIRNVEETFSLTAFKERFGSSLMNFDLTRFAFTSRSLYDSLSATTQKERRCFYLSWKIKEPFRFALKLDQWSDDKSLWNDPVGCLAEHKFFIEERTTEEDEELKEFDYRDRLECPQYDSTHHYQFVFDLWKYEKEKYMPSYYSFIKFNKVSSSINRHIRYIPGGQFEGLGWHREVLRASLTKVEAMIVDADLSDEEIFER